MRIRRPVYLSLFVLLGLDAAQGQTVTITPERANAVYQTGEPVRWDISVSNASQLKNPTYTIKTGGITAIATGALTLTNGRTTIESSMNEPGWLLLEVNGTNSAGASLQTFGGAMIAPDRIVRSGARPADFDEFWQAKLDQLATVPINPVLAPGTSGRSGVDYAIVQLDGISGTHVRGQLARPSTGTKFPALLIVQWAGVYGLQKPWVTDRAAEGWLVLNTQAHDITPLETDAYYQALSNGALKDYPRQGNEDRETSYFLRMYLACHRAAEYLTTREDWDGQTLVVMGASQGGLQALVTAALHPKVTAALAEVPAGSDQTGVDVGRVPGWPQWLWQAWDRDAAKVRQAARYYDVTHFAPRIHCPVLTGVGFCDTVVPPPGVYATYNLLSGARQMVGMPTADHQNNHTDYYPVHSGWLADARTHRVPTLRASPQSASAIVGGSVSLTVAAENGRAFGYQWLKNGTALPGATEPRLTLSNLTLADDADYSVVVTSPGGTITSAPAHLSVSAVGAGTAAGRLVNISTRADCGLGDNVAIGGFVVSGRAAKRVLVRAVGASLTGQGLGQTEVLLDPVLEVHDAQRGNIVIASNDDWAGNANASELVAVGNRVGAAPLLPTDYRSSAVLLDLPAGVFSFVVRGKSDTTGIVLLEVYDADEAPTGMTFADIASRARAGTGNAVAIGGFVIAGTENKQVLLRALGPTLTTQGIGDASVLRDPTIELHDARHGNAIVATNDNWADDANGALLVATGGRVGATPIASNDTRSSALLRTLGPGAYSFIARATDSSAGIVLVEVYDAD